MKLESAHAFKPYVDGYSQNALPRASGSFWKRAPRSVHAEDLSQFHPTLRRPLHPMRPASNTNGTHWSHQIRTETHLAKNVPNFLQIVSTLAVPMQSSLVSLLVNRTTDNCAIIMVDASIDAHRQRPCRPRSIGYDSRCIGLYEKSDAKVSEEAENDP